MVTLTRTIIGKTYRYHDMVRRQRVFVFVYKPSLESINSGDIIKVWSGRKLVGMFVEEVSSSFNIVLVRHDRGHCEWYCVSDVAAVCHVGDKLLAEHMIKRHHRLVFRMMFREAFAKKCKPAPCARAALTVT